MQGGTTHHQAVRRLPLEKAVFSICPQLITAGSPSPRKLRLASVRIAKATDMVIQRNTTRMVLGRIW